MVQADQFIAQHCHQGKACHNTKACIPAVGAELGAVLHDFPSRSIAAANHDGLEYNAGEQVFSQISIKHR